LGDPKGEAIATIGAAHLHSKVGEKQEAIDGYSRALKQVRLIGDIVWEASIYSGLRYVYSEIGDLNKALQTNIKALMLFQRARVPQGVLPSMMITGQLYHQLKALQKALTYLNQARRLSRLTKVVNLEPALLREIGSILDELGQADEALKYYNEATTLSRAAGDGHLRELASSLRSLADWYFRHDSNEKALGYLNEALAIARKADHKSEELATLYLMAQVERDLSHPSQAMLRIEEALRLFELLRSELKGPELRTTYVATVQKIYDLYIDLLMREHRQNPSLGFAARALEINERARARTLVESLLESRADIRENVDADLLKRETELLQRIIEKARYRDQLLMKPYGPAQVKLVEAELREMDAELQLVRSSIRAANPRYAAQTASQSLGASEIQALLDPETLLLEYRLGDERSYVWAVSQTSVTSYELPARRVIEDEVLGFYQALTEGADSARGIPTPKKHLQTKGKDIDYRKSAARLSQMLLSPVAAQLRAKRLVIVADGALQYINFAALSLAGSGLEHQESAKENSHRPLRQDAVTPEAKPPAASTSLDYQPLMLNHEIINLPSAAVLAVLRQQFGNRPPASKSVAVIADPVFDKNDERLKLIGKSPNRLPPPTIGDDQGQRGFNELLARTQSGGIDRLMFSYQEAEAILQAARGAPTMQALGFEASREKILHTDLSAYRFIHFATHGFINNENPDLSGIVLSLYDEHGNQQNGYLRLSEICNLRLNADLVVLSACQTALGKEFRGEGLMGLTRGFMQAGALRVIASLWNVNDKATAELMKLFYNKLLIEKMPPAQALRAAQIELFKSRRWQSPYYWAGFVIQGEWN
jgi:CHAT domain-containing protein